MWYNIEMTNSVGTTEFDVEEISEFVHRSYFKRANFNSVQ